MLWNVLIKKIGRFIEDRPDDAGSQTVAALAKVTSRSVEDYVEQFNVHEIENLRKIIPNAFPRVLRGGVLHVNKNIHGAWRVQRP